MKANHVKMKILPILNEVDCIFTQQIRQFQKYQPRKNSIFQQPVAKKMQNLKIFGEVIVYL